MEPHRRADRHLRQPLSGSEALERAIDWTLAQMSADGLENVRGEPAMVPHWVRGAESAELVTPRRKPLAMLGLGGSVGTPRGRDHRAGASSSTSFDELAKRGDAVKGKIVLFDVPVHRSTKRRALYRGDGAANAAAKQGAVADAAPLRGVVLDELAAHGRELRATTRTVDAARSPPRRSRWRTRCCCTACRIADSRSRCSSS